MAAWSRQGRFGAKGEGHDPNQRGHEDRGGARTLRCGLERAGRRGPAPRRRRAVDRGRQVHRPLGRRPRARGHRGGHRGRAWDVPRPRLRVLRQGRGRPVGEENGGLLRLALKLDAAASGASGALLVAAGSVLDDLLGLPLALLLPVGLFLLAYAAFVWVADSVALVATAWFPLTALGAAFVLAQAAAVFLFANLQFLGLRRARRA